MDPRGEPRCCWPEDGRSLATASTGSREDCSEGAACWKQIQVNPTAQEPYAIVLPGFKALQTHLGLSRHANPALINSQHFPLPLSRLAFLLSLPPLVQGPFPKLGAHGCCHKQSCPRPHRPAALLQPLTKLVKRRCPITNPRAANSTEPRQPQEHQHSPSVTSPEEETKVSSSWVLSHPAHQPQPCAN